MSQSQISLRKDSLKLFKGALTGRAINFMLNTSMSRILGPESLGLFSLILSTSQTFEITARCGIDYGLQCELTKSQPKDVDEEVDKDITTVALYWTWLATSFLIILLITWVSTFQGLFGKDLPINKSITIIFLAIIVIAESLGGLPWDILLVQGQTRLVALRQGLFAPLKILCAVIGSGFAGISGALMAYAMASSAQTCWIQKRIEPFISRKGVPPKFWRKAGKLIGTGLPLYVTNALSAMVFLPLLAGVAIEVGISDVGYLRIGQLVVQLFTLIPGAVAPILFLKLRQEKEDSNKIKESEKPLQFVWSLGLISLLIYCVIDRFLINWLFGSEFLPSIEATRILVLCAVLDSSSQVLYTPLLASEKTRLFALVQNASAITAGIIGWIFIPKMGLEGYLIAKISFAYIPAFSYSARAVRISEQPRSIMCLLIASVSLLPLCWSSDWAGAVQQVLLFITIAALTIIYLPPNIMTNKQ